MNRTTPTHLRDLFALRSGVSLAVLKGITANAIRQSARCVCCLAFLAAISGGAQSEEPAGASNTFLEVEIMTPRAGGDLLAPQRWGQVFDKLGIAARVRSPLTDDVPAVSESSRGPLRFVKLIGQLDGKGQLNFPGRTYKLSDTTELKAWLEELKLYGAQGSPQGEPLWGLSDEQFEAVFKGLAQPVQGFQPTGKLDDELGFIPLAQELPIGIHSTAEQLFATPVKRQVPLELNGLSAGTALATLLNDYGLGFRPVRTPQATIELIIEPLEKIEDPWPLGWDLPEEATPGHEAPTLFQQEPFIGIDKQPLASALQTISQAVGVPFVINQYQCRSRKIDLSSLTAEYPHKRNSWAIVLRSILGKHRVTYTLRNDEMGTLFVYVHPFERKTVVPPR